MHISGIAFKYSAVHEYCPFNAQSIYFCLCVTETRAKGAIAALENRDWDKEAQEFAKKRRAVEAQSQGAS